MKCKYEHDDDCCYSCADQYMCKCKQPCEFLDPMTNADRIRQMSDFELAKEIENAQSGIEIKNHKNIDYFDCILDWLQQPSE